MGKNSAIEWTDHTYNPWWGCQKVSPGCANCYAETFARRYGHDVWGPSKTTGRRLFDDRHWNEPLKWNRAAERASQRKRVFCASMADVFEDHPALPSQRERLWSLVEQTPWLDWLLLTKRPENIERMMPDEWSSHGYYFKHGYGPDRNPFPRNIWLGTSAENQEEFNARWPVLESVGRHYYAAVLFLSAEPLLGPLDLTPWLNETVEHEEDNTIWVRGIDWVIVGGESGPSARPMHPDWARSLRDQCVEAEVPFFFKQWGEYLGGQIVPDERFVGGAYVQSIGKTAITVAKRLDDKTAVVRVGKKNAGRILDGRTWSEFPQVNQ